MGNESTVVRRLLERWESEQVSYCHWKSTDHLVEALSAVTDLDVLVARADAVRAEVEAMRAGFVRMETATLRQYPGVMDYIAFDEQLGRFVHLHLHYQLVLGDRWVKAYRVPVEQQVLNRRVLDSAARTWVVSPADELVMFVLRMAVKFRNPFGRPRVQAEGRELAARMGQQSFSAIGEDYPDIGLQVARRLQMGERVSRSETRQLRRSMIRFRRMGAVAFFLRSRVRLGFRLLVEFCRRVLKHHQFGRRRLAHGGLLVAFVGMDGAGKTTAIERADAFFSSQLDVESVFLGSGRSGAPWYRRLVLAVMGQRASLPGHRAARSGDGSTRTLPFYYLLWIWRCSIDRLSRMHRAFNGRSSGRLVLCDRWPQTTIQGSFDGPRLRGRDDSRLLFRKVSTTEEQVYDVARTHCPDVILRFSVSPEVAMHRKPGEFAENEAVAMSAALGAIDWPARTRVVDINADRALSEVDAQVRVAIWEAIAGCR